MILVIDNYDSFTCNLVQRLGEVSPGLEMKVFRNDKVTVDEVEALHAAKPESAEVASYLATLYRQQGRYDRAVAVLEDLLDPEIEHWIERVEDEKASVREWTIRVKGYDPGNTLAALKLEPTGVVVTKDHTQTANNLKTFRSNGLVKLEMCERSLSKKEKLKIMINSSFINNK